MHLLIKFYMFIVLLVPCTTGADLPGARGAKKSRNGAILAIPNIPVTNLKAMLLQPDQSFYAIIPYGHSIPSHISAAQSNGPL